MKDITIYFAVFFYVLTNVFIVIDYDILAIISLYLTTILFGLEGQIFYTPYKKKESGHE